MPRIEQDVATQGHGDAHGREQGGRLHLLQTRCLFVVDASILHHAVEPACSSAGHHSSEL